MLKSNAQLEAKISRLKAGEETSLKRAPDYSQDLFF